MTDAAVNKDRAERYSRLKTRLFLVDLVMSGVWLVLFQIFLSGPIASMAQNISAGFYGACFVYGTIFIAYMYLLSFPLHYYASFMVEHDFGLSVQSVGSWFADELKSLVLSFVLSIGCIVVFYFILRTFPAYWWAIAGCAWIFFTIVLARLLPVIIIPLFFKYLPLEDTVLKEKIMSMAEKAGIGVMDVCRIDFSRKTKKANAALVGLGSTRKVVLSDTLTDDFDHDEIENVIAHEFAHHKYRHIWKLLVFSAGVTLLGFYVLSQVADGIANAAGASGIDDIALLPVLILLMAVFGILILPVQNLFSRYLEKEADEFALEQAANPEKFASVMNKLADMNLADREPSTLKKIFLYDHPPIEERIRMAEEFRRKR